MFKFEGANLQKNFYDPFESPRDMNRMRQFWDMKHTDTFGKRRGNADFSCFNLYLIFRADISNTFWVHAVGVVLDFFELRCLCF